MTLSSLLVTPRGTWPQPLQGRHYPSVSLTLVKLHWFLSLLPSPPFLRIFLSFSCSLSMSISPFLSFILLSINSSPKLCLHGIFVSHPPRSLAQRISVDSHHLRSGPLVQKSLHLPLGPISGGFPSISCLSITASVYHSGTLKITLVSSVD